jgi:tryptophan-rich sensory protein
MSWYETLTKPSWAPPASLFGTVWSILYPIILIAYGFVIVQAVRGEMPRSVLWPVLINLAANAAFTPIQFGLRNLVLAELDIIVVLVTIVWSMIAIWPHARLAAIALVPYLIWVSIATVLQTSITLLNRT